MAYRIDSNETPPSSSCPELTCALNDCLRFLFPPLFSPFGFRTPRIAGGLQLSSLLFKKIICDDKEAPLDDPELDRL